MVKKSPLSIFKGTQAQMYAVVVLVWQNYAQRQADFAKKNKKYTVQLAADQQDAVKKAREMPDVAVRRDVPKEARQALATAAGSCTTNWQALSSLIESSYPETEWDIKKGLAGYANYAKAGAHQWDAVVSLTNAGADFISENEEALTTGGMLPEFPTDFAGAKNAFDTLYEDFYGTKQNFSKQTIAKANASNAVYKTAMRMMKDAKQMYRNDAGALAEFTYSSLMKIVRGQGFTKTGCCFILKAEGSGAPVTKATVTLTSADISKSAKASSKGIIRCELPAGTYQFTLTAAGYDTISGTIKITAGTMSQKKLALRSAAAGTGLT